MSPMLTLLLIPTLVAVLQAMAAINRFVKDIRELRGLWGFILDWAPWKRRHKSRRIGYVIEIINE